MSVAWGLPLSGTKLGRYQIVKHLASGGMAEVLLARASGIEGFERHVVIKRIRPGQAKRRAFVQMFLDEARLAAQLHHHNIVQVHDIGQEGNEYFFAMEYVHGEDLRRLLTQLARHKQKLPLEHVVTIITAAARRAAPRARAARSRSQAARHRPSRRHAGEHPRRLRRQREGRRLRHDSDVTSAKRAAAIDAIRTTPAALRAAVGTLTDTQLDTPYRPGGWTVRQLVHHVPESHMNAFVRFKLALTEENPTIKPYNEDAWAKLKDASAPDCALIDAARRAARAMGDAVERDGRRRFHSTVAAPGARTDDRSIDAAAVRLARTASRRARHQPAEARGMESVVEGPECGVRDPG